MTLYAERLLPHNLEAEEAVIGSLLIDGDCFSRIAPILQFSDFYRERNQICFAAAQALFQRDEAIDQLTLAGELARTERLDAAGGIAYLSHLVSITPTSVHSEDYAEIVSRTSTMRKLIDAAAPDFGAGVQRHRGRGRNPAPGGRRTLLRPGRRTDAGVHPTAPDIRPVPAGPGRRG